MTTFFGYKRLVKLEDWQGIAGEKNWVPTRSAYELACAWHAAQGLPSGIRTSLDNSGHEELKGVNVELCLVEKPVFLNTHHAPSMTDVMAYGHNAAGSPVLIGVEGKADEVFGPRVAAWVRGDNKQPVPGGSPSPSRLKRLKFLGKHLGHEIDTNSELRYQLLHRTVSVVLEAQLHGAAVGVVVVQAFGPESADNWHDFEAFLEWLGCSDIVKAQVAGPCLLGEATDIATYFLWLQQPVGGQHV